MVHVKRRRAGVLLAVLIILSACVVLWAIWLIWQRNSPYHNLRGNVSSAQAEMRDVEREISQIILTHGAMPPELIGKTPLLTEIPQDSQKWIHSGDGRPLDPFQKNQRYRFSRLSSGNWFLFSTGPDRDSDIGLAQLTAWDKLGNLDLEMKLHEFRYDSTNGAISSGDLWRLGSDPFEEKPDSLK